MEDTTDLDMVSNSSDDSGMGEVPLQDVFDKNFETLKDIYHRVTGGQTLKRPDEFMNETTMSVRGEETMARSSVPYEQLINSEEGEWRGVYLATPTFIRYFLFLNNGPKPMEFNAFSLRVGKSSRQDSAPWAEIRLSTMPVQMVAKVLPKSSAMGGRRSQRRVMRQGNLRQRRREKREEMEADEVGLTQDATQDERFEMDGDEEDSEEGQSSEE